MPLKWRGTVWRRWLCEQKNKASLPPRGGRPKSVAGNGRYRWSLVHPVRVHRPTSHDPGRIDRLALFSAAGRPSRGPWRNRPTSEASLRIPTSSHNPGYHPRTSEVGTDLRAVRSADMALSEKSPYLRSIPENPNLIALCRKPPGECQAETVSWDESCWMVPLPLELRCSLVTGLKHEPQHIPLLALASSCETINSPRHCFPPH